MQTQTIAPQSAAERLAQGACLIDIRETDEFARAHIKSARSQPLSALQPANLPAGRDLIFTCRSGMRTTANARRLAAAAGRPVYLLEGGLDAWRAAGLPVETNQRAPLEMMRQVQIAAGSLVLAGVLLSLFVNHGFIAISAFVGAGLLFAGVSGFCGMARLLAFLPWNRLPAE